MDDAEIVQRIGELVDREHRLEGSHGVEGLSADELAELRDVEEALDQCWDLLRQRRARRSAGQDPDAAVERPREVVERYRQ